MISRILHFPFNKIVIYCQEEIAISQQKTLIFIFMKLIFYYKIFIEFLINYINNLMFYLFPLFFNISSIRKSPLLVLNNNKTKEENFKFRKKWKIQKIYILIKLYYYIIIHFLFLFFLTIY